MSALKSPFTVEGARNVFLETVKRGENDDFKTKDAETVTVILRLYEAFGGHAQAQLRIANHLGVTKAYITNLLEDHEDELNILRSSDGEATASILKLDFRGFEVKTVKLVLKNQKGAVFRDQSVFLLFLCQKYPYPFCRTKRESWINVDKLTGFA